MVREDILYVIKGGSPQGPRKAPARPRRLVASDYAMREIVDRRGGKRSQRIPSIKTFARKRGLEEGLKSAEVLKSLLRTWERGALVSGERPLGGAKGRNKLEEADKERRIPRRRRRVCAYVCLPGERREWFSHKKSFKEKGDIDRKGPSSSATSGYFTILRGKEPYREGSREGLRGKEPLVSIESGTGLSYHKTFPKRD